jgi:hypothetical protein
MLRFRDSEEWIPVGGTTRHLLAVAPWTVVGVNDNGTLGLFEGAALVQKSFEARQVLVPEPGAVLWAADDRLTVEREGAVSDLCGPASRACPYPGFSDVWSNDADEAYVLSLGRLYHVTASTAAEIAISGTGLFHIEGTGDALWIGDEDGVQKVGGGRLLTTPGQVVDLWADASGSGLAITRDELYQATGGVWDPTPIWTVPDPQILSSVWRAPEGGSIWVSTANVNGGVWRIDGGVATQELLGGALWIAGTSDDDVAVGRGPAGFLSNAGGAFGRVNAPRSTSVHATPSAVYMVAPSKEASVLHRWTPWAGCASAETSCTNQVDDDCDGFIDQRDSECP